MNKIMISTAAVICIYSFGLSACGSQLPQARVTVTVVDEEGTSLSGVRVGAAGLPGGGADNTTDSAITGRDGRVTLTFRSIGTVEMSARGEGYYPSYRIPYTFPMDGSLDLTNLRGRWEAWGPEITVELKTIRDPIPMYVKSVNLGMPDFDVPLGYDLMTGDWVRPYGEGSVSDLVFLATLDQRGQRDFDYELCVTFSNPGDGIQPFEGLPPGVGSELQSSHYAPEDGYLREWVQWRHRRPDQPEDTNLDINRNYFVRVRTELDEEGRVKSAYHGKIYGDFLQFTHYLNPEPNSRNIEYNGKTNLVPGARSRAVP